jgi:Zn-dependent M28 family amino/carboxypeptidase
MALPLEKDEMDRYWLFIFSYFSAPKFNFMYKLILSLSIVCLMFSCTDTPNETADAGTVINKDSLLTHISTLASDSFLGRRPFTEGETKTIAYLQSECKSIGLEPGNGDSYLQEVPLVEITPKGTPQLSLQSKKGKIDFKNMEDFVIFTERTDTTITVDAADLVFCGFGVVAPEYNWNDFEGLDLKNKVVLVMVNDPGFTTGDSTLFKGKTMTYYGRWTYKFEEAARLGAKGCLIVHNTAAASYPFAVVQNSNGGAKLHLDSRGSTNYQLPIEGWVSEPAAKKILAAAGLDSSVFIKANQRGFKPIDLGMKVSAKLETNVVFNKSNNVIAKITGSTKPDEYIFYTAHWDHLGVGKPDANGDSIYNGALDNASGTSAILEVARAFKNQKEKPERTVVFLWVTAEEQGLLGSAWYGAHPVYPAEKTVADINIDVVNADGPMKDMSISGAGQSELEDMFSEEMKKQGRYVAPEARPEAGTYFRSDHFSFAKIGVPSLTADKGLDHVTKGKEYGKQREEEWNEKYYHQQDDEYDTSRWDINGAVQDIGVMFQVGRRLAYGSEWPKWKEGSEFKAIREKPKVQ